MPDVPPFQVIDARGLLPPEPMELTLEALDHLPPGQVLELWLYREPFPLYSVLQRNGFRHACRLEGDGSFVICIRHATDPAGAA